MNPEAARLRDIKEGGDVSSRVRPWERWGAYVSERAWGTVREDYSADGNAWDYFPHEHARSRAYRWSEDGIAGFCDRYQVLVFAPAFWNGRDPILKERLFGVNSHEGNHGEDVKEVYYHLDALPTHSYLKYLYKYPQDPFPYERLIQENGRRTSNDEEFDLADTGVFDEDRYFDIFVEYAKAGPDDICIRIEGVNRGKETASLHIIPQLWFRNQWAWGEERLPEPEISLEEGDPLCLVADDSVLPSPKYILFDYHLGKRYLYAPPGGAPLFTGNETNSLRLWGKPNKTPYVKDAFHRAIVDGEPRAANPLHKGTKAAIHYNLSIPPGQSVVLHFRLTNQRMKDPLRNVDEVIDRKKREADLFYQQRHPKFVTEEEKSIQRQAWAGMIWGQQIYIYDVSSWLAGDNPRAPPPPSHATIRNVHWGHIVSYRILSMPDKWEYPWFAAWDLAFHALAFAEIDIEFAKKQIWTLLFDQFQHPNGAIPAYEWEFSDMNPPVQAWAALKMFELEKKESGREDFAFLEKCFHKFLLNFSWWINRVDNAGNNVFEGGFLGMDNIGLIGGSATMLPGCSIDQADGVGWMAMFCLNLTRIALILSRKNPVYEGLGIKFFQHFIYVAASMRKGYGRSYDLWNEQDGFFYSRIRFADGSSEEIPARSLHGIIPLFACDVWEEEELRQFPAFYRAYEWLVQNRSHLAAQCIQTISRGEKVCHLFGLLGEGELKRCLRTIWDPREFRSEYGLRSFSKFHETHPIEKYGFSLRYEPGESLERVKGGNSNWRGPIWLPVNYLLIDTLLLLDRAFGDEGFPSDATPRRMADSFILRLIRLFQRDEKGRRPLFGDSEKFQTDPHFRDLLLFYEHFHADTGRGLGASHQTGWTGLIALLIQELRSRTACADI